MSTKKPSSPKVLLGSNNSIKLSYDPETNSVNLITASFFPALITGGWGDPHLYLRAKGTNRFFSRWGDNKSGSDGNNEILFLYMKTSFDDIKVYYSNASHPNGAKVTTNIRVEYNNQTFNYNQNTIKKFGPIRLSIRRRGTLRGGFPVLDWDIDWDPIPNLRRIGGALGIVLRRTAFGNGAYINGKDGRFWDGYSFLGQPFGLSRTDFESGSQSQSVKAMNVIAGEFNFVNFLNSENPSNVTALSDTMINSIANNIDDLNLLTNITDEDDNEEPVVDWDPFAADAKDEFENKGPILNQLAFNLVNNVTVLTSQEEDPEFIPNNDNSIEGDVPPLSVLESIASSREDVGVKNPLERPDLFTYYNYNGQSQAMPNFNRITP